MIRVLQDPTPATSRLCRLDGLRDKSRHAVVSLRWLLRTPSGFLLMTRIDPDKRMLLESIGGGIVSEGVGKEIGVAGWDQ